MDFSPEQRRKAVLDLTHLDREDVEKFYKDRPDKAFDLAIDLQCQLNAAVDLLRSFAADWDGDEDEYTTSGTLKIVRKTREFLADFPVPEEGRKP